jgi:hypothetical protein
MPTAIVCGIHIGELLRRSLTTRVMQTIPTPVPTRDGHHREPARSAHHCSVLRESQTTPALAGVDRALPALLPPDAARRRWPGSGRETVSVSVDL